MSASTAIAPPAAVSNVWFVCSGACHADRATKKWSSALAAAHTCGRQQDSLNTFAAFMFT
jgi:sulfatase maturation enzyme AslB (radical SAM superfamily)